MTGSKFTDRRCFVQFLHPGPEHKPDAGHLQAWNTRSHRRKFLLTRGVTEDDARERDLMLWGEWEPESEVVTEFCNPVRAHPRYVYLPYWSKPSSFAGLQNTDPFVFGAFYYSICKQVRSKGPTQLRHLARGSVILFGSHLGGEFVLDSVFVVGDFVDHTNLDYRKVLKGQVPEHYPTVALAPFYRNRHDAAGCVRATSLRLYIGATVDDPYDEMFSYFPCQTFESGSRGFARPRIQLPGIVNPASKQANRLNRDLPAAEYRPAWRSVREQVIGQGCEIGVRARFPERRYHGPVRDWHGLA